jgi:probable O-glycosylation ligase (exosortase A-associated)
MRDLVFAGLFFAMAVYSLQSSFLGLALWLWSALWPVNDYVYGFARGLPFNKIAVVCTVAAMTWDKKKRLAMDALLIVLTILLAEISLSYALSDTPPGWGEMYYQNLVKIVVAAFVVRFVATDRLRVHVCLLAMGAAVGAGAADEALKFLLSGGTHHVLGPSSWGDENSTATMVLMVVPILLYLYQYAMHHYFRVISGGTLALCVIGVIGTYSRGGFIGLAVLSLIVFLRTKRKFRSALALSFIILLGAALVPDSWTARITTTTHAEEDSSFMYRVVQWKILTLMALDKPLLGHGILANMVPTTWSNYAARLASELTFFATPPPAFPQASHSIFFQMLGENGFIGLGLFCLLHVIALRYGAQVQKAAKNRPDLRWAGDMATALRVSLIVYLVTGSVLPIPYLEFPYLLIGCMSALRAIVKQLEATSPLQEGQPASFGKSRRYMASTS